SGTGGLPGGGGGDIDPSRPSPFLEGVGRQSRTSVSSPTPPRKTTGRGGHPPTARFAIYPVRVVRSAERDPGGGPGGTQISLAACQVPGEDGVSSPTWRANSGTYFAGGWRQLSAWGTMSPLPK